MLRQFYHGARRAGLWLCLGMVFALGLTGCAVLGGGRSIQVPGEFIGDDKADWAADADQRAEFYELFFRDLPKIHILGQFVASSRLMPDSDSFYCTYFALSRDRLRMRIKDPVLQKAMIDMMIDNGIAVIKMPEEGLVFRGPLANGHTPFGRKFGVEPWHLIPIFRIGQTLATESFDTRVRCRTIRLTPTGGVNEDGLTRVVLDRRSGLPSTAVWHPAGAEAWEVRYVKWDYFTDRGESGQVRLMPAEMEISSPSSPGVLRITLPNRKDWGYYFGDRVPPKLFKMRIEPGLRVYSLDQLDEVWNQ